MHRRVSQPASRVRRRLIFHTHIHTTKHTTKHTNTTYLLLHILPPLHLLPLLHRHLQLPDLQLIHPLAIVHHLLKAPKPPQRLIPLPRIMHVRIPRPLDIKHPVLPSPLPRQRNPVILPSHPLHHLLHPMRYHHLHLLPHPIQHIVRQHARRRIPQLFRLLRPTLRLLLIVSIHKLLLLLPHIFITTAVIRSIIILSGESSSLLALLRGRLLPALNPPGNLTTGSAHLETDTIRRRNPLPC